ncbi:MAG TPA: GspE/PulE family protein [Capsulimonadaceae bacterium]
MDEGKPMEAGASDVHEQGPAAVDGAANQRSARKFELNRLLALGKVTVGKVGKKLKFRRAKLRAYRDEVGVVELNDPPLDGAFRDMADDAPIVRIASTIMLQAIRDGASDIHVEPERLGVRIRHRVDGVLHEVMQVPKHIQEPLIARFKILADLNIADPRLPQSGNISILVDGRHYDFRLTCIPTTLGVSMVMRIMDKSKELLTLEDQGLNESNLATLISLLHKENGMIVISGPTRSGKTSLLYSCLQLLNRPETKILTIEDPVEFAIPGIGQVQVEEKDGLTFSTAIPAFLHQDANVIMVSDTFDIETARLAVEAAMTGHIVLTTMHTWSATDVLRRFQDLGVETHIFGAAISAVVNLRMARKLCNHCKAEMSPEEVSDTIKKVCSLSAAGGYEIADTPTLYRATGCPECSLSGYRGRIPLHEMLVCSSRLVKEVVKSDSESECTRLAVESGMRTLLADGITKAVAGETSIDEILRVTTGAM